MGLGLVLLTGAGCGTSEVASAPAPVESSATASGAPGTTAVVGAAGAETLVVAGEPAVLLTPAQPNGGLVLFLHGASGRAQDLLRTGDGSRADLAAGLVAAGYAVAASDAHGDAWGSAESVAAYRALAEEARRRTGATAVHLLAESMGGLAAAQLTAPGAVEGLRSYAGIYPVCDLSSISPDFAGSIEAAFGADTAAAVAERSPVRPDPAVPLMIWASTGDTVVPRGPNADVCVEQVRAGGGQATLVPTTGEHGDRSNFDLPALLAFFDATA